MKIFNNSLLIISTIVLFFASYIALYDVIPIVNYEYKASVIDSILFLASYITVQFTLVLFTTKVKNRLVDIGLSIVVFTVVNIWFYAADVGHMYSLYNDIRNMKTFTNTKDIACFAILLALFIDLIFSNIFHTILIKFKDFWVNNAQEILKDELIEKQKKEKSEAKEIARKKNIENQRQTIINESIIDS